MTPLEALLKSTNDGLGILYRQHRELMEEIETMERQKKTIKRLLGEDDEDQLGFDESCEATLDHEAVAGVEGGVLACDEGTPVPLEPLPA